MRSRIDCPILSRFRYALWLIAAQEQALKMGEVAQLWGMSPVSWFSLRSRTSCPAGLVRVKATPNPSNSSYPWIPRGSQILSVDWG